MVGGVRGGKPVKHVKRHNVYTVYPVYPMYSTLRNVYPTTQPPIAKTKRVTYHPITR